MRLLAEVHVDRLASADITIQAGPAGGLADRIAQLRRRHTDAGRWRGSRQRDCPRDRVLGRAAAGEPDRAAAEGRRALAIMRKTRSSRATRELRRLGKALGAV